MGPLEVQPSAAFAAGGAGVGQFPQRKLSGDLKLRLARLPSLGGEGGGDGRGGGGDAGRSRRVGAYSSRREHTDGPGTHRSSAPSISSIKGPNGTPSGAGAARRLSLTSARDGFSLVPTTGSVAVNGGVDSSRLNWRNPLSGRGGSGGDGRGTSRSGGGTARSVGKSWVGDSCGGGGGGGSESGGGDEAHLEFMRELASQNGLQLRCAQGGEERSRHQREVQRRIEIQERCIRRPSVGQSKSLLKAKILGSIGGGPFELLRAFRKMHCGRGTVIDVHDFKEAVKKLGLGLNEQEILDFFRSFDADGSGGIDFNEFCEWVGAANESEDSDGDGEGAERGGFRPSSGDSTKSVSKRKMRDAQAKVKAASEKVPLRTMKENEQLLREKILGSIGGGPFQLLRAFRKMHRGRGTVVDLNDFREAVTTFSLGLGEPEVVAFFKGFDADGSGGIDFEEFCAWVAGADAADGEGGEHPFVSEGKPTKPGGGAVDGEEGMTPAQKAQDKVTRAFREQAGKMSSETLHKVLREKLISTVKPGGGTLLRTYHNLHRSGNVGGVELGDFKEAVHRYGMGVTDAQVEKLFRRYDKDGSGDIDFHEFLKLIMYAEDLAPEDQSSAAADDRPRTGDGGDGAGIRPLSPGWAAGEMDKQGGGGGGGGGGDGDNRGVGNAKGSAENKGLTGRDGGGGDGGGGADGVVTDARCNGGASAERRAGHRTSESVLDSSPVTRGAKAEDKMKACVRSRWRHMLTAFRRHDPLRSGTVTFDEFRQVLKANKAMQSLGKGDVTALANKHSAPRGRVEYPNFMRLLLLGGDFATRPPAGGGRGRQGPAVDGGRGGRDGSPRPFSSAQGRGATAGLTGSKSMGALAAASPSASRRSGPQTYLHPIERPASRGGEGGGSELGERATLICRELKPHIMRIWKPLWKDLKAADQSAIAALKRNGGGCGGPDARGRPSAGSRGTACHTASSGHVETHVFSFILARHGLELSNRDLMTLEHLPTMAYKGWALPGTGPAGALSSSSSSASSPTLVAATAFSAVESEGRKRVGGSGRVPYESFFTACLMPAAR